MFLNDPEALVQLIAQTLRPGGRLVLHEYVQWDTFALIPGGEAVARFVQRCIGHWQASGGDPHIARRLPTLLERHGLRLVQARSLQACERGDGAKALWLRPEAGIGNHVFVACSDWAFNFHGYALLDRCMTHSRRRAQRLWPGWHAQLVELLREVLVSEAKSRAYDGLWLREPGQFLHNALPRARAFLNRFPAPRTHAVVGQEQ
jgi:hypothetical protein